MLEMTEVAQAAGSGALVAAAKFLWDIRNDARAAMAILTGRTDMEGDGLVHEVAEHDEEIEANGREIAENAHRIENVEREVVEDGC